MRKICFFLLLSLGLYSNAHSQFDFPVDKTLEADRLVGGFIRVLQNTLLNIRESKTPIYLGNDTLSPVTIYDSIPLSTYGPRFSDYPVKHGIKEANVLEILPDRINFYCKNHVVIDSTKIIFSISVKDLRRTHKNLLCRKVLLDFFYETYYKKFSLNYYGFYNYKYASGERLINIAANEFAKTVNLKKIKIKKGYFNRKVRSIPVDSLFTDTLVEFKYMYQLYDKSMGVSFEIKEIGFSYIEKSLRWVGGLALPSMTFFIDAKKLEKVLGEGFSFFILESIRQEVIASIENG